MTKDKKIKIALPSQPKRTMPPERAAASFVDGAARVKAERLTVYLPTEIAEAVRVRCAKERRSLSDAAQAAFILWISKQNTK